MRKEITFDQLIRWVGTGLLIIAILLLVNYLSNVLLPFFIAWFMAYLLYPVVQFIENKLHIRVRAISILLTMLLVIAVIGGVFYLIVPPHDRAVRQASNRSYALGSPHYAHQQPDELHLRMDTGKPRTHRTFLQK